MTDATTTNLGITYPTVGADDSSWGTTLNNAIIGFDAMWANIGNVAFGTVAVKNTGTSGATVPLLNGTNTWANPQTFSSAATFTAAPVFSNPSGTRTALGLGNVAVLSAGASAGQVPVLSGDSLLQVNITGSSTSCSGNAATATAASGVSTPGGWTINDDGAGNLIFKKNGVSIGYVTPTQGFVNLV